MKLPGMVLLTADAHVGLLSVLETEIIDTIVHISLRSGPKERLPDQL